MVTHGGSSDTRATSDVACGNGCCSSRRNRNRTDDYTRTFRLAGSRCRSECRRALDGPGWIFGGQVIFDRLSSERLVEITVERLANGEVSPYLTQELAVDDRLELRGPIGGWFVWRKEQTEPVQLVAGGSGIVPLMAMIRYRVSAGSTAPFRLLYSVREPGTVYYRDELQAISDHDRSVSLTYAYTRAVPEDWPRPPGRIDAALVANTTWPSKLAPTCYVCGPTPFVTLYAIYITFETPLSGMSMNPARTFGSAFQASYWHALWIYCIAPTLGMLAAASSRGCRSIMREAAP